jgi:hypothetical protein
MQAPKAPIVSCFTSANTYQQGWPAVESLQYNSTVSTWRTPLLNSIIINGTNVSTTVQNNATWSSTNNFTGNASVSSTQPQLFSEPFLCASYKVFMRPRRRLPGV